VEPRFGSTNIILFYYNKIIIIILLLYIRGAQDAASGPHAALQASLCGAPKHRKKYKYLKKKKELKKSVLLITVALDKSKQRI